MPKYLHLPKIGMNMEEGVISEWLVQPGEYIQKEQMVVRAETDKAVQDMFATDSGILYKILAHPGEIVPCQGRIAMLLDKGEQPPKDEKINEQTTRTQKVDVECVAQNKQDILLNNANTIISKHRIRISPLAKKIARELDISIEMIHPASEGTRIVKSDVIQHYEAIKKSNQKKEILKTEKDVFIPYSHKRKIIARRMVESVTTKPRVSHVVTVDCEAIIVLKTLLNGTHKVTYNEIIMKACATALKKYPELNVVTTDGGVIQKGAINIGIAIDHPDGLLVPVVKNVDNKGIYELACEFGDLVTKAKNNALTIDDMSGGTFTISNLGMFGVESFDPIINIPECFILGVGSMSDQPVVEDNQIKVKKCMKISLCFDHTVIDGAPAAKLLREIKQFLESPLLMLG